LIWTLKGGKVMKKLYVLLGMLVFCGVTRVYAGQSGQLPFERKQQLQEQLEGSAFRKGVSGGIQGVIKVAPSDHSPITVKYDDITIASWNLLSDEHTLNFFFNVSEKKYFAEHKRAGKPIAWKEVFNDFGHFVFNNSEVDQSGVYKINITKKLMDDFIAAKKLKQQDIQDAQEFVNIVLDSTNPYHEDIKTSLIHILEIKFGIDKGYLQWKERFKLINQNKLLVKNIVQHDFLCFQECTNPQDMLTLVQNNSQKDFAMLYHRVKANSEDNCVIIYDKNKYELIRHHNFGLAQNRKPCIVAQFRSLKTDESLIVGSIHHAGTGKSEISLILEQVNQLLQGANDVVMVCGDYNHQSDFYRQDLMSTGFELKMPSKPTMAGFEYGNVNKAIDGVLTNRPIATTVHVLEQGMFASQVVLPMNITFEI
jgi:hypothetical protein